VLIEGSKRDSKVLPLGSLVEDVLEMVGPDAGFCSSPPVSRATSTDESAAVAVAASGGTGWAGQGPITASWTIQMAQKTTVNRRM